MIRYIRRSRKESTNDFGLATKTVYYRVLQQFNGDKWIDVQTVNEDDLIKPLNTKNKNKKK